jgi:hypothetical protein
MPTLIHVDSSPDAPEIVTNVASGNVSNKRKIYDDQNEKRNTKTDRKEGETMLQSVYFEQLPATSRKSQCWPCDMSSSSNHKGSKEKRYEICPTPGCGRKAQIRGHCRVYNLQGNYTCQHTGCSKACRRVGTYCRIHATDENTPRCAKMGCNSITVQTRKFCYEHDDKRKKCNIPECSNQAHARGICKRHDPRYTSERRSYSVTI